MDAWVKVSVTCVIWAFTKAWIIAEQLSTGNSNETDSDNDKRDLSMLDAEIVQLLNSDTEDKEFDGFVDEGKTEKWVYFVFYVLWLNNVESYCEWVK